MTYHFFIDELDTIPGCSTKIDMEEDSQFCQVFLNNEPRYFFYIPDPNDFVENIILAKVLSELRRPDLIPLYELL